MESCLERSHHMKKHIPRGELVELLSKALLYTEVEAHWKGDSLSNNCKTGFSLLEPHVCSLDVSATVPLAPTAISSALADHSLKANGDVGVKRKSSTPSTEEGRVEKRPRKDVGDKSISMDVDAPALKSKDVRSTPGSQQSSSDSNAKKTNPKRHTPPADVPHPSAVRLLQAHNSEVFVAAWNPSTPGQLISGSRDAVVNFWNIPNIQDDDSPTIHASLRPSITLSDLASTSQADLTSLDWNHDGSLVAIGSYDSILRICTAAGKIYLSESRHKGPIFAGKFSRTGQWLVTASLDGSSCVWDVKNKRVHRHFRIHDGCCLDVDWLDESTFASCGADRLVHIVSLNGTQPIQTLKGHSSELNSIKCNPSRTQLVSCPDDGTARIWSIADIHNQKSIAPPIILEGHRQCITSVDWCPNTVSSQNELLATASFDMTARLWDSKTGECLKVFSDHLKHVYALRFSPDGLQLASGGGDGSLHIYDVHDKKKIWSWFSGEKSGVFEIDWRQWDNKSLIALALERRVVAIIDPSKVPALRSGHSI
ncbi:WD40-repeat-containing domain protein [Hygrophoropsis aurantiaca]|uniref:WD40-repeat-containing domain protein n=1 Tax=Hygrophoropsis aurantiaca TaxID=72124 RepID=A0ACB8AMQ2_9AGAM|nr:WD40-repeat-containing domain protein [Hygrophoropsis aurantiaca]